MKRQLTLVCEEKMKPLLKDESFSKLVEDIEVSDVEEEEEELVWSMEEFMKGISEDDLIELPYDKKQTFRDLHNRICHRSNDDYEDKFGGKSDRSSEMRKVIQVIKREEQDKKTSNLASEFVEFGMIPVVRAQWEAERLDEEKRPRISYNALRQEKVSNLYLFNSGIRNGFYHGFLSSVQCEDCRVVLDTWPSREKNVYLIKQSTCRFCLGQKRRCNRFEIESFGKLPIMPRDQFRFWEVTGNKE